MTNLKKYLKRKQYQERPQLESRQKFGILEKHKDYVIRTKEIKKKTDLINRLRKRAEEKNPDEFHFSMEHERTNAGVPIPRVAVLSKEDKVALKTKELNFINFKIKDEARKIEKLKSNLHLLGAKVPRKHIIFVETKKEAINFKPLVYDDCAPKQILVTGKSGDNQDKLSITASTVDAKEFKDIEKERARQYKILEVRMQRLDTLKKLANEMMIQKRLAKGEECIKIEQPDGSISYKWKTERKR